MGRSETPASAGQEPCRWVLVDPVSGDGQRGGRLGMSDCRPRSLHRALLRKPGLCKWKVATNQVSKLPITC